MGMIGSVGRTLLGAEAEKYSSIRGTAESVALLLAVFYTRIGTTCHD
jgi:hypothetical protein